MDGGIYKKSRHASNMKAGRVVQASVMVGCYDLQCQRYIYSVVAPCMHALLMKLTYKIHMHAS
jgi:hypothetical protein